MSKFLSILSFFTIRWRTVADKSKPLGERAFSDVKLVEIRPSKPLLGIFDIGNLGGGILAGAMFPGITGGVFLRSAIMAISGFFMSRQAKVWGTTLAFAPSFTDKFFDVGYKDALVAIERQRLN